MNTIDILHNKYNSRYEQIPPIRVKGFNRTSLAQLFNELGFQYGAEVGVAEGKYSIVLCESIPGLKLNCVDLWDTYYRVESPRVMLKNREMQDWALNESKQRLASYNVNFIRKASMKAVEDFKDGELDFVYIDANHGFDWVMQDIIEWTKKVRNGGIVSGHDYYRFKGAGVVDAINAYTHAHQIHEWFVCDERECSFFWAKGWGWTL